MTEQRDRLVAEGAGLEALLALAVQPEAEPEPDTSIALEGWYIDLPNNLTEMAGMSPQWPVVSNDQIGYDLAPAADGWTRYRLIITGETP